MPFFEFTCRKCGEEFELLLPISDRDGRGQACPRCGAEELTRRVSAPQVAASGDGGGCGHGGGGFG